MQQRQREEDGGEGSTGGQLRRAAIFDLDGTLIPHSSSEKTFFLHLIRAGGLSALHILQMAGALWTSRGNFHEMIRANKRYLRHQSPEKFEQVAREYFEPRIEHMVFVGMRDVIERHRGEGDLLLLLSGTLSVIAQCFVRVLNLDGAKATDLEVQHGRYTGRVVGVLPYGMGKLEVLRELRHRYGIDSNHTTVYANIFSDRYLMNAVETAVAVNPDSRLRAYAQRSGWQVLDFKKTT